MSANQSGNFSGATKKAVHVKWAGKTIALGTFPAAEADEKCARAKALTRAWRSSMRPKPSRDWVMLELERLGVRVVSGRLGRKAGEEGEDGADKKAGAAAAAAAMAGGGQPAMGGQMDRNNSLGWGAPDADLSTLMARRNSSLGMSMMNDAGRRGSLGSLGQVVGMDSDIPPHRPMVGGGAAAAYEASRHDHYSNKGPEQQRRTSSLGLGTLTGGGLGNMGMSVNPNQHYEMLKLHHMNLLNEIQETTLMMNLYQQQQLQQQQQQLQQQAGAADMNGGSGGGDPQMQMLLQQQQQPQQNQSGMDPMFGSAQMQQRSSLGLGGSQLGGGFGQQQQQPQQQQQQPQMQMSMQQQSQMQQGDSGQTAKSSDANASIPQAGSQEATAKTETPSKQDTAPPPSGEASDAKRSAEADNTAEPSPKRTKVEEKEQEPESSKGEEGKQSADL